MASENGGHLYQRTGHISSTGDGGPLNVLASEANRAWLPEDRGGLLVTTDGGLNWPLPRTIRTRMPPAIRLVLRCCPRLVSDRERPLAHDQRQYVDTDRRRPRQVPSQAETFSGRSGPT